MLLCRFLGALKEMCHFFAVSALGLGFALGLRRGDGSLGIEEV